MKNNETESNQNEWSKRDIGALWKKEGKNQKYLSGYVKLESSGSEKEVKVVVFANKNKNKDTAPDYRIYVSKPAINQNATSSANEKTKTFDSTIKNNNSKVKKQEVQEEENLL